MTIKKLIYILISILIITYIVLSLMPGGREHAAEKLLYRANKAIGKIALNPDVAPPAMLIYAESTLKAVLEKYPETVAAKHAKDSIVRFYMMNKEYDKAIGVLDGLLNAPEQDRVILSGAHFLKGNVYEMQGEADKALAEYAIVRDEFKDTPIGIQVPLYIGDYYKRMGKEAQADKAYNDAAGFYREIEKESEGKPQRYVALTLLAQAYIKLGRYEEAGEVIEDTINAYPAPFTYRQHLPGLDFVFVNMLNRPEKAIEIFNAVKEKTSDANLKKMLEARIEQLKEGTNRPEETPATEEASSVPDKP